MKRRAKKLGNPTVVTMRFEDCKLRDVEGLYPFTGGDKIGIGVSPSREQEGRLALAQTLIESECDAIKKLLLEKNRKYGNSALEPSGIFSKASPREQIFCRIDDKLKRIKHGSASLEDEDVVQDLIGYLMLLRVERRYNEVPK
jgi:hypothetical protein